MAKTKPYTFPTRFTVPGRPDGKCWARSCMQPGENKGTYAQGRGYTSYYDTPKPVCVMNEYHGCPYPIEAPNPENARCCHRPSYRLQRGAPTRHRQCDTCGSFAPTRYAKNLNALPSNAGSPCKHEAATPDRLLADWYGCPCAGYWDHRPARHEASQHTIEGLLAELRRRSDKLAG